PDIGKLAENMTNFQSVLIVLSVLLMIVFSFLINYAMKFIVKRRKREFGIYALLGMERKSVSKMFLVENLLLGSGAIFMGLPIGFLLYQILNAIIMSIFDSPYQITVDISIPAILSTLLLFLAMYCVTSIRCSGEVTRTKIKDLIYGDRYNEMPVIKRRRIWLLLIFISIMMIIFSFVLIVKGLPQKSNSAFIMISIAVMSFIAGIYILHAMLPVFISFLSENTKEWYYKGTNLFLAGQIKSKVNTTSNILAVSAVLLALALVFLMMGMSMGAAYKSNIAYEAPFDITVSIDADVKSFDDVLQFIKTKVDINSYLEYKIYEYQDDSSKQDSFWGNVPIIRLSDYNYLRRMIGLDAKTMNSDEFIVHSDTWHVREEIRTKLLENPEINITGKILLNKQPIYNEPFEQFRTNGDSGYIVVVPDDACKQLLSYKSRLVVGTKTPAAQSLKGELTQYVKESWKPVLTTQSNDKKITMHIGVKSWSIANGLTGLATLSFGAIYISLILFLITGTLLSFQQSSEDTENKYRFSLLRKLGTNESDILLVMRKQISFYFALPAILPVMYLIFIGIIMNLSFGHVITEKNVFIFYTGVSLIIFGIVYGIYLVLSYTVFKISMRKTFGSAGDLPDIY
ncbi:MAG: ABC transporter permease, partial [Clostridiaceae bacterium]|nr:ABC transporter permease [Clostridiaceae bacterium]